MSKKNVKKYLNMRLMEPTNLTVTKLITIIVGTQNHRQIYSTDSPKIYYRIS